MTTLTVRDVVHDWLQIQIADINQAWLRSDANTAATAAGNFLGKNDSDPNAQGIAIYKDPRNLPTAIASILNHTQNKAGFHPASIPADKLAAAFGSYVTEIDKTPFLHLVQNSSDKQKFESSNYNALIDRVVGLYDGVSSQDKEKIKQSIVDMAKSVFTQTHSEDWKNLFAQSTLDFTDYGNPTFILYYTSLYMYHDKNGKSDVAKQEFEVRATKYQVLPEMIKAYAEKLVTLDVQSVDNWLSDNTSPKAQNIRLCFEK